MGLPTHVDVVVVSYNSRDRLRACVEPFVATRDLAVVVVDNASLDRSLDAVADLPITRIECNENGGFARGCNVGWRGSRSPYVLFLNPDASIDPESVRRLVAVADDDSTVGAVAPRILGEDGELDYSIRRFPRLRSTLAQALFLHRLFPSAPWADETVRRDDAYRLRVAVEWASGACLLVRRSALEQLDGFDEAFFMYCEDKDLCRRLADHGYSVVFEPAATCVHVGGASAPRSTLLPVLVASRLRYARKHRGTPFAQLERGAILLGALTHALVGGRGSASGHLAAAAVAAGIRDGRRPPTHERAEEQAPSAAAMSDLPAG